MSQYFDRAYQYLKSRMGSKVQGSRKTNPSLSDKERVAIENLDIDAAGMKFIEDTEGYFPKVYDDKKGSRSKKGGESDFGYINPTKRWMFNYSDTGGHATIGYGKLIHPREVKAGIWNPYLRGGPASMTREEARKILRLQVEEHLRRAPLRFFEKITRVPTQNQLSAMASIIFNTGGNTKKVKKIIAAFNAGDDVTAARLLRVYSGFGAGGLPKRRFNEGELYEKGTYGNPYRKVPKEAVANWRATGAGAAGGAVPQKKKGPPVFLLGDSNTTPHKRFWKAWIAKQFGRGARVTDKSQPGNTTGQVLKKMKDADGAKGVIIGSVGGNNVSWMGKRDVSYIEKALRPNGPYYQKHVVPLMSRLKELQDKGTKIIFYGLPFGRGEGKKCKNNTPVARQKMDELLAFGARQYGIPYNSVFEETRTVKGKGCGVHYGRRQYGAYRNALRSKNPNAAPLAEEEKDYAQSVIGGKKIKIASGGSSGRWLSSYKYIQAAGISLDILYKQLGKVYGPTWAKDLLPKHGADRVFGPEHFAAMVALAKKTNNNKLMAMLMKRSSFRDPVIAKAEAKAVDNAMKVKPEPQSPGAVMPVGGILQRKKKAAEKVAAAPSPINFEQVIHQAKPGDNFILNFTKEVKWGILTVFEPGKTYTGSKVLPNGEILVNSNLGKRELTKKDFISQVKSRGKPCNIVNCDTSYIIRPYAGKKSFTAFLKNPSFGGEKKAIAENKKKCKIRIILNC